MQVLTSKMDLMDQHNVFHRLDNSKHSKGQIIIIPEQLQSCRDIIIMEWKAKKLDRKDFAGKSDPFMVFYKQNSDNR